MLLYGSVELNAILFNHIKAKTDFIKTEQRQTLTLQRCFFADLLLLPSFCCLLISTAAVNVFARWYACCPTTL